MRLIGVGLVLQSFAISKVTETSIVAFGRVLEDLLNDHGFSSVQAFGSAELSKTNEEQYFLFGNHIHIIGKAV